MAATSTSARSSRSHHSPHILVLPSDLAPFTKVLPAPQQAQQAAAQQAGAADASLAPAGSNASPAPAATSAATPAKQSQQQQQQPVVCVNPGRLTKGAGGGTYAHISVQPGEGALAERCRVEIRRI